MLLIVRCLGACCSASITDFTAAAPPLDVAAGLAAAAAAAAPRKVNYLPGCRCCLSGPALQETGAVFALLLTLSLHGVFPSCHKTSM